MEQLNKRWFDYTGTTHEQVRGWRWKLCVHSDDLDQLVDIGNQYVATGTPIDGEARLRRFDGEYRWFLFRPAPAHDETGKVVGWYGVITDIEDRRRAEEALHVAQTALAHASRVATLGEVSATIAHEVNQPLAAIVVNGQACLRFLSRETPDLSEVRNGLERMVKDANRASEVIQSVRGLLKKADTQKVPVDVNEAIHEVAALLRRELAAQEVSLQQQLAPARLVVSADLVQLQQVLINLVMNGVEAMQGIVGRPRTLLVRSYEDEARQIAVSVSDTGPGIPAEMADRVFDAFFSTKPAGLGMGLSICRSIIEVHCGQLRVMTHGDGPGATFHFTLPAYLEAA